MSRLGRIVAAQWHVLIDWLPQDITRHLLHLSSCSWESSLKYSLPVPGWSRTNTSGSLSCCVWKGEKGRWNSWLLRLTITCERNGEREREERRGEDKRRERREGREEGSRPKQETYLNDLITRQCDAPLRRDILVSLKLIQDKIEDHKPPFLPFPTLGISW